MRLEIGDEQIERLVLVRVHETDRRIGEGVHPVSRKPDRASSFIV
jgi:hypothetical protein